MRGGKESGAHRLAVIRGGETGESDGREEHMRGEARWEEEWRKHVRQGEGARADERGVSWTCSDNSEERE